MLLNQLLQNLRHYCKFNAPKRTKMSLKSFCTVIILVLLGVIEWTCNTKTSLEGALNNPEKIDSLDLSRQGILMLPANFKDLKNLKYLNLSYNKLSEFPDVICSLKKLKTLDLSHNFIVEIPEQLLLCKDLEKLTIAANPIIKFPHGIQELENLRVLNLSNTNIKTRELKFAKLKKLEELHLNFNEINKLPESLKQLEKLLVLKLYENSIPVLERDSIIELFPNTRIFFDLILENDTSSYYISKGGSFHTLEKYEEAIYFYNKAIRINSSAYFAYRNRGAAKQSLGKFEEALDDYKKALSINSNLPLVYFNMGLINYDQGNQSAACLNWEKAASLGFEQAKRYLQQFCKSN